MLIKNPHNDYEAEENFLKVKTPNVRRNWSSSNTSHVKVSFWVRKATGVRLGANRGRCSHPFVGRFVSG